MAILKNGVKYQLLKANGKAEMYFGRRKIFSYAPKTVMLGGTGRISGTHGNSVTGIALYGASRYDESTGNVKSVTSPYAETTGKNLMPQSVYTYSRWTKSDGEGVYDMRLAPGVYTFSFSASRTVPAIYLYIETESRETVFGGDIYNTSLTFTVGEDGVANLVWKQPTMTSATFRTFVTEIAYDMQVEAGTSATAFFTGTARPVASRTVLSDVVLRGIPSSHGGFLARDYADLTAGRIVRFVSPDIDGADGDITDCSEYLLSEPQTTSISPVVFTGAPLVTTVLTNTDVSVTYEECV